MGNSAGQRTDGLHFLGMAHLRLQAFALFFFVFNAIKDITVAFFGFFQGFFGLFTLGDIFNDTDPVLQFTLFIPDRSCPHHRP